MFVATFVSNCPRKWQRATWQRKWPQLLRDRLAIHTRHKSYSTNYIRLVSSRCRKKKKDLKYYKRAPGVGKGRRWGFKPGVQEDADQLQGRSQEVGRDHWTKVLGGDRGKRSLGHLSQKFAIGEADWGVSAH